jgi:hypothetical protein
MVKRRHIVSLLTLLLFVVSAFGKPVTLAEVREAVYSLMDSWNKSVEINGIEARYLPGGELGYYMVDLGGDGWVMVSGDDVLRPVLAFSFETTMTPEVYWNDAARYMLDQYKEEIAVALKDPDLQRDVRWDRASLPSALKATAAAPVSPFIDVNWNQGSGWNMFCPEDPDGPGGHAYVGCVAVAMAQAMTVYDYPTRPEGIKSYYHDVYGSIAVNYDLADPYDWNQMSATSADAFNAILLYHCAVSVEMDFGPDGSGAYVINASSAMKKYFGYPSSIAFHERYADDTAWVNLLVDELVAGRPVIYRGNPGDGTAGHAWNLDGYYASNEVNYFHMNFGWSGSENGYYTLDAINPGTYEFNSSQGALVGIVPPASGPIDINLTEQSVLEGLPVGSWVADVEVTDQDPSNTYTFTCKGPYSIYLDDYGPASFYIEDMKLYTDKVFEYNDNNPAANSEFLLIIVEDQYGNSYQEEFYIDIEKAYYGPTGIALSDSSVLENQPVGTSVGALLIEDELTDNSYTYILHGPYNQGTSGYDPPSFYVENDTLKTSVVFEYEVSDTSYVLVELEDSFGNMLSRAFTIRIEKDQSGSTGNTLISEEHDLLYPNPADDRINWKNPDPNLVLEIYEVATGRKLSKLQAVDGTIDVSHLQEGMYLVVIRSSGTLRVQKLLIQH